MASKLFDEWSELANKPEIPTVPRRKSEESINDIEIVIKPPSPVAQPIVPEPKPAIKRQSPELQTEEGKRTKMAPLKKSVKFPESDEDLCKYFVFERHRKSTNSFLMDRPHVTVTCTQIKEKPWLLLSIPMTLTKVSNHLRLL